MGMTDGTSPKRSLEPETHNKLPSRETLESTTAIVENDDVSEGPIYSDIASNDGARAIRVIDSKPPSSLTVVDEIVRPECEMKDDDILNHHASDLLPSSNFYEPVQESMKNLSITIDPQESKAQAMRTRRANNQAHERAWVRAARSRHKRNQRKHGKTFYSGNILNGIKEHCYEQAKLLRVFYALTKPCF